MNRRRRPSIRRPSGSASWSWRPRPSATSRKDLGIATWLTEGLVRQHGYAGLRDGFRLLRELVEAVRDNLYPLPDEEGLATRLACLAGLNGEESDGVIIAPIAGVSVTAAGSCRPLTLAISCGASTCKARIDPDKREPQRIETGDLNLAAFAKAVPRDPA